MEQFEIAKQAFCVCKLCLGIINDENFKVLDEVVKEALVVVLQLKMSDQENNISVICDACSARLFVAFNFKTSCTDTENRIIPYVNSECKVPIDLREIYLKERGTERLRDVLEDYRICRLCMQVAREFTSVNNMDVDMLCLYIPEVNFSFTKEPVICKICLNSLDTHINFLKRCLNAIDKIKDISDYRAPESICHINVEKIEVKPEDDLNVTENISNCKVLENLFNINTKNIRRNRIKSEAPDDYEAQESLFHINKEIISLKSENCLDEEDKIKNISEYEAPGGLFHIRTEEIEFKSEECYNDTTLLSLKNEPLEYTSECQPEYVTSDLEHSDAPIYRCDPCNYRTVHKSYFKSHQLSHKDIPEAQMHKCNVCDYKTHKKRNLTEHVLKHRDFSDEQMYKCDWCDYKTIQKRYLTRHAQKHKNYPEEQMYMCELCDYKTGQKSYFARHQHIHKDIPEQQMYKCDLCDYKNSQKRNVTRHAQKHRDHQEEQMYMCESCDYKTHRKSCLVQHLKRHKHIPEDQMFKCDLCDYQSGQKRYFARHQLIHQDVPEEQMYECDLCYYETGLKHYFVRHQLIHKDKRKGQKYKC